MTHSTLHAVVRGRVQGVGFRITAQEEASRLGVRGWVRNLPDGTVELRAAGDRALLETFLDWLGRVPAPARVERVDATWIDGDEEALPEPFTIRGFA